MEVARLPVAEARAALERRELSAVDLARSALDRIEAHNESAKALIFVRPGEQILDDAAQLDALPLDQASAMPLRGIPVALKANFQCAGAPTSAGSAILRDWIPNEDADTVALLRRAGAVIVGMANMNEFANGPTGYNPHYGSATNPWDPRRMPGGSSSGSAVALALGMCLVATGSDTGGSIRTPSAFCGTAGLKPTLGSVSTAGVFPFSPTLDHVGPMARSVADLDAALAAMRGDLAAPSSPAQPDSLEALTVGIDTRYFTAILQADIRAAFEGAVQQLEELGADIRPIELTGLEDCLPTEMAVLFPEAAHIHRRWLDERPGDYADEVRESLLSGRAYSAVEYLRALDRRAAIRRRLDDELARVDVLATPTTIIEPPLWDQDRFVVEGHEVDSLNAFIRCTAPFNLSGHPALSLPCGVTAGGLPVGLQLVAAHGADDLLLQVGRAFEQASPPPARATT